LTGAASRDLPEIGVLDLHRDGAAASPGALAVAPDRVDDVPQLISSRLIGEEIDGKCILGANGLPYAVGADGPLVDAARGPEIIGTRFPEMLLQEIQGLCPEIQPSPNPICSIFLAVAGPIP